MSLLRGGASLTGAAHADLLAARTWTRVKAAVAEADPELASDLLIAPHQSRAVVLTSSELEDTILLAMEDDPASLLAGELAEHGWHTWRLYRIEGSFTPMSRLAGGEGLTSIG